MAARRTLYDNTIDYGQPIPESPARQQADILLPEYIGAWVRDQKPSIAKNSTDITNKLIEMGFESKDDLKRMRDHTVLMAALGINYVQAMALVDDAMAMHHQPTDSPSAAPIMVDRTLPPVPPVRKLVPYEAWTGKMEVPPGSHVCSEAELHRWMAALLCFVEAQSPILGPILREFCINPGMQDPEYNNLHAKIPEFDDRQLAHAISGSIPSSMQERITTTLGIAALGLDILRQVTAVHYGSSAIKFKIKAAADLCYNKGRKDLVPVCNRMDAQGNCQLPQGTCIFRHPIPSVPPKVADIPSAPQQVQHVAVVVAATGAPIADTVSELAEIKTLLLGLLQEQVSQKAFISAILAETTDE